MLLTTFHKVSEASTSVLNLPKTVLNGQRPLEHFESFIDL